MCGIRLWRRMKPVVVLPRCWCASESTSFPIPFSLPTQGLHAYTHFLVPLRSPSGASGVPSATILDHTQGAPSQNNLTFGMWLQVAPSN